MERDFTWITISKVWIRLGELQILNRSWNIVVCLHLRLENVGVQPLVSMPGVDRLLSLVLFVKQDRRR